MPISRGEPTLLSSLFRLAKSGFSGRRKQIRAELVIPQSDLARPEATPHEHWPEIAFAVIHFMIVDFDFPAEAKPKCG